MNILLISIPTILFLISGCEKIFTTSAESEIEKQETKIEPEFHDSEVPSEMGEIRDKANRTSQIDIITPDEGSSDQDGEDDAKNPIKVPSLDGSRSSDIASEPSTNQGNAPNSTKPDEDNPNINPKGENEDVPEINFNALETPVIDGQNKFETLVEMLEDKGRLADLSESIEYDKSNNILRTKKNVALSFKKFAHTTPLTIKTFGHDLVLAGHSLQNVIIDTSIDDNHSGNVLIFLSGTDLPTINTTGYSGKDGKDAECTTLVQRCVQIQDRETRIHDTPNFQWMFNIIDQIFPWTDPAIKQEWRDNVHKNINDVARQSLGTGACPGGVDLSIRSNIRTVVEGTLIRTQIIKYATQENESSQLQRDSILIPGTRGEDGGHSGNVKIFQLANFNSKRNWIIPGGSAGKGGLNLKTPAAAARETKIIHSEATIDHLDLRELKVEFSASGLCFGEYDSPPRRESSRVRGTFRTKTIPISTDVVLQKISLQLPALSEGRDLDPWTPTHQASGLEGRNAQGLHQTIKNSDTWKKIIPLEFKQVFQAVN